MSLIDAQGRSLKYVSNITKSSVHWKDFIEPCSGVREYAVELRDAAGTSALAQLSVSTSETSLTLALAPLVDAGTLVHGDHYTIVVIATSHAGLASEVSARFRADLLPPSVAVVADGPTVAVDAAANAGILAAQILATAQPELLDKLKAFKADLINQVNGMIDEVERTDI